MKKIIGRVEKVHLIDFDIAEIDAKVDTGAYTSSIHCKKVQETSIDGIPHLKFVLMDKKHNHFSGKTFVFKDYFVREVKSSNGIVSKRFSVKTKVKMANKTYKIEFTLNNRSSMKYPILLGRKFLNKKFLVDTSVSYQTQP
jgi:hypothetical protein